MTDHLTRMLHDAGTDLDPGLPPAAAVLADGRRRRRRRRTTSLAVGGAAAATLVLAGALLVPGGTDRAVDPVAPRDAPTFDGVTYAIGNEVYLDGGDEVVEIDDAAVKSLYYSSAGVIVRHGENSFSDGGGPQRFTLIREDGSTSPISVETEENAHGVDTDQPYLAWTEVVPGGVEVVVHDVDTDAEVARVPVEGDFDWSPPPVALDSDTAYVGGRSESADLLAVDWRSGEVRETDLPGGFPSVSGGRTVLSDQDADVVLDVATSEVLHREPRAPGNASRSLVLAPSGAYVAVVEVGIREPRDEPVLIDLGTEAETTFAAPSVLGVGWSASSQPFGVADDRLVVCSPVDGACDSRPVDLPGNLDIRLGGLLYES